MKLSSGFGLVCWLAVASALLSNIACKNRDSDIKRKASWVPGESACPAAGCAAGEDSGVSQAQGNVQHTRNLQNVTDKIFGVSTRSYQIGKPILLSKTIIDEYIEGGKVKKEIYYPVYIDVKLDGKKRKLFYLLTRSSYKKLAKREKELYEAKDVNEALRKISRGLDSVDNKYEKDFERYSSCFEDKDEFEDEGDFEFSDEFEDDFFTSLDALLADIGEFEDESNESNASTTDPCESNPYESLDELDALAVGEREYLLNNISLKSPGYGEVEFMCRNESIGGVEHVPCTKAALYYTEPKYNSDSDRYNYNQYRKTELQFVTQENGLNKKQTIEIKNEDSLEKKDFASFKSMMEYRNGIIFGASDNKFKCNVYGHGTAPEMCKKYVNSYVEMSPYHIEKNSISTKSIGEFYIIPCQAADPLDTTSCGSDGLLYMSVDDMFVDNNYIQIRTVSHKNDKCITLKSENKGTKFGSGKCNNATDNSKTQFKRVGVSGYGFQLQTTLEGKGNKCLKVDHNKASVANKFSLVECIGNGEISKKSYKSIFSIEGQSLHYANSPSNNASKSIGNIHICSKGVGIKKNKNGYSRVEIFDCIDEIPAHIKHLSNFAIALSMIPIVGMLAYIVEDHVCKSEHTLNDCSQMNKISVPIDMAFLPFDFVGFSAFTRAVTNVTKASIRTLVKSGVKEVAKKAGKKVYKGAAKKTKSAIGLTKRFNYYSMSNSGAYSAIKSTKSQKDAAEKLWIKLSKQRVQKYQNMDSLLKNIKNQDQNKQSILKSLEQNLSPDNKAFKKFKASKGGQKDIDSLTKNLEAQKAKLKNRLGNILTSDARKRAKSIDVSADDFVKNLDRHYYEKFLMQFIVHGDNHVAKSYQKYLRKVLRSEKMTANKAVSQYYMLVNSKKCYMRCRHLAELMIMPSGMAIQFGAGFAMQ